MAKPKSVKLRSLIMLRTLFKYSDTKHPISFQEMNEHLRPYALDCDRRSLNSTIETLNEFGIKVSYRPQQYAGKSWIEDPLFSDKDISCLVFALTTNPYISQTQATKILEKLKPFVTVYQEPLLTNHMESDQKEESDDSLRNIFSAIQNTLSKGLKIQYTTNFLKYDKNKNRVTITQRVPVWFSPKCFYKTDNELYMIGFKRSGLSPCAINLKDITSVRIPGKPIHITDDQRSIPISEVLSNLDVPSTSRTVVYKGPVIFRCRGRYLELLYLRFGAPSGIVK